MENYEQEIIKKYNKSIFPKLINPNNHLIFLKYSKQRYYKYSFELLETLIQKSSFNNKHKIFHTSLYFLLKILYNSENITYCSNLDLIILVCFFLGIKTIAIQKKMINITKLKNIYPEKYLLYKNEEIKNCEMICIYLLKYDINFLTIYDCICFLLKNETNDFLKNNIIEEFESKLLNNGINYFIYENPLEMGEKIIKEFFQKKEKPTPMIIQNKKILNKKLTSNDVINHKNLINFGNEENLSTSESSGSVQNSNKKPYQKKEVSYVNNNNFILESNKIIPNNFNLKKQNLSTLIKLMANIEKSNGCNSKFVKNHNSRYSITKNSLSKSICFDEEINSNILNFQNLLGNTYSKLNNSNNESNHNINCSNIYHNKNSLSSVFKESSDILRKKNIFRKPLVKNKTSNNNLQSVKKCSNIKNINLYKDKINNKIINDNENENFIYNKINRNYSNFYKNYNDNVCINPIKEIIDKNNNNECKEYKYKNINKIRGKSILQRFIKNI